MGPLVRWAAQSSPPLKTEKSSPLCKGKDNRIPRFYNLGKSGNAFPERKLRNHLVCKVSYSSFNFISDLFYAVYCFYQDNALCKPRASIEPLTHPSKAVSPP